MIILNFSHSLTDEQIGQIQKLTGQKIDGVRQIPTQFDNEKPFIEQIEELISKIELTPHEWQTLPILIVPPSLNFIAVTLMAALHGLMGYFPPMVRLKPVPESIPPRFEVAEIINLQSLREEFRKRRS